MAQTAGGTYYAASSELVSSWPATSLDLANQLETRFSGKVSTAPSADQTITSGGATVTPLAIKGHASQSDPLLSIVKSDNTSLFEVSATGELSGTAFGAWSAYTPTTTGITLGNGTLTARYVQIGKTVSGYIRLVLGSTSAITGSISFTTPTTVRASCFANTSAVAIDSGTNSLPMFIDQTPGNQTMNVRAINASATYAAGISTSATVPFTWTNTDELYVSFSYEAA